MISIRAVQHYAYCPHRWGLLYLEDMWTENAFTVRGDILHERVHTEKTLSKNNSLISLGGVSIYSASLGIYGKADLIELIRDPRGGAIKGFPGKYLIRLIEFKPTSPRGEINAADRLQVYAQYCCVRELFGRCDEVYFYFADTRRRTALTFGEDDHTRLFRVLEAITAAQKSGSIPPVVTQNGCNGCSMEDICMPRVRNIDVRNAIRECL